MADLAPEVETLIWSGSPAGKIVQAAEELGAGLIVVGSRGAGMVDSVLMGSVSHRVLSYAHCPVLVVRPTSISQEAHPVRESRSQQRTRLRRPGAGRRARS